MESSAVVCSVLFALVALVPGPTEGLGYLLGRSYMEPCERGAGACMTSLECGLQRGQSLGSCSIGVCCRVEKTCNEVINFNNTFFVHPADVRPSSSCSVAVEKKWVPGGICQLKLDFLEFETVGPSFQSGMCLHDTFSVAGADKVPPIICGLNDRQHMYVDVRNARNIHLMMNLGLNVTNRRWKIKVSQIPCYSPRLAPPDCLQYYEEPTGYIKSFNYGNIHNDTSYQLNLRYRMCFRETCTVQLNQLGSFGLGAQSAGGDSANQITDVAVDTDCVNHKSNSAVSSAYIAIDDTRFCGSRFLRSYETTNPVSSMTFQSPLREVGRDDPNRKFDGFMVQYRQNCGLRGNNNR
ncbi:uncharacterized protein LOC100904935 [Galendromus occidentalis]|uniref:Uncharacterized protein LOC100904935 n=1 Tax=Galendromus occidentalis TaxID=34638 RepID=A0AAJ6VW23_9ACAR|nr:uncharacterized protein LOC100904935 [Galendromus occidentalis]